MPRLPVVAVLKLFPYACTVLLQVGMIIASSFSDEAMFEYKIHGSYMIDNEIKVFKNGEA